MTLYIDSMEACVDHLLDTVVGDIVLGIPLGVGKPNPFSPLAGAPCGPQ